jgi:hypothetical protein
MSGHKVDYKDHYGCLLTILLYYFSKEEIGQDD